MRNVLLAAALAPLLVSCGGDEAVNFSAPVGIDYPAIKSADVGAGGAISTRKNVNTESGNPFGAFVNDAEGSLGRTPSRVAVTYVTLQLLPTSNLPAPENLNQLFTGTVTVSFVLNGTAHAVGTFTNPSGTSVRLLAVFDTASLAPADFTAFLGGGFDAVVSGTATADFAAGGETADLQTTFGFVAYQ